MNWTGTRNFLTGEAVRMRYRLKGITPFRPLYLTVFLHCDLIEVWGVTGNIVVELQRHVV